MTDAEALEAIKFVLSDHFEADHPPAAKETVAGVVSLVARVEELLVQRLRLETEMGSCESECGVLRDTFDTLYAWTQRGGRDLCPPTGHADTYGEGMRAAKHRVGRLLASKGVVNEPEG